MQFTGSRDGGHAPFENNFSGILSGRSRGACLPNLKFVSLAVLELLAFNAHNLQGHVTVTTPRFENFFRDHAGTFPGSMHAKLEVRIFNHFGAISI